MYQHCAIATLVAACLGTAAFASCPADINGDGEVNVDDLLLVLNNWGPCGGCPADLTGSGSVNVNDLLIVIDAWGVCMTFDATTTTSHGLQPVADIYKSSDPLNLLLVGDSLSIAGHQSRISTGIMRSFDRNTGFRSIAVGGSNPGAPVQTSNEGSPTNLTVDSVNVSEDHWGDEEDYGGPPPHRTIVLSADTDFVDDASHNFRKTTLHPSVFDGVSVVDDWFTGKENLVAKYGLRYRASFASGSYVPDFFVRNLDASGNAEPIPSVSSTDANIAFGSESVTVSDVVVAAGQSIVVVVRTRDGTAANRVVESVEFGEEALSVMSGTPITQGNNTMYVWKLSDPTPGTQDVVATAAESNSAIAAAVYVVDNAHADVVRLIDSDQGNQDSWAAEGSTNSHVSLCIGALGLNSGETPTIDGGDTTADENVQGGSNSLTTWNRQHRSSSDFTTIASSSSSGQSILLAIEVLPTTNITAVVPATDDVIGTRPATYGYVALDREFPITPDGDGFTNVLQTSEAWGDSLHYLALSTHQVIDKDNANGIAFAAIAEATWEPEFHGDNASSGDGTKRYTDDELDNFILAMFGDRLDAENVVFIHHGASTKTAAAWKSAIEDVATRYTAAFSRLNFTNAPHFVAITSHLPTDAGVTDVENQAEGYYDAADDNDNIGMISLYALTGALELRRDGESASQEQIDFMQANGYDAVTTNGGVIDYSEHVFNGSSGVHPTNTQASFFYAMLVREEIESTEPPPPPTATCVTETNTLGSHEVTNEASGGTSIEVTETNIVIAGFINVSLAGKTNQELADELTEINNITAAVTDAYSPSATNTLQEWSGATIAADGGTTQLPGDEECPTPADVPEGVSGALVPLAII